MAPQAACEALEQLTLSRGAKDNVTVVVVRALDRAAAGLQVAQGVGSSTAAPPQPGWRPAGDEWHVDA